MTDTPPRTLRVFIGFDPRQVIGYTACATSILTRSTRPVAITPLVLETLPLERRGLTPFTYSRFLVPWLCGFEGWALFVDSDVIFTADPVELFANGDDKFAVVVRDELRYPFERAAMMLFNCAHPDNAVLTPDYVGDAERCRTPHLIDWTGNVGAFDVRWGHLVGYDEPRGDARAVHFTQGVPAWPETFACEWSEEWMRTLSVAMWPWAMRQVEAQLPWAALMGDSVHARMLADGRLVPKLYDDTEAPAVAEASAGAPA